jgi:class 3 adenylate cyclase/tetratricopeptide (TPR) repeat protein
MLGGVSAETCPRCGEPLPPNASFCPNCGAPVSLPDASERRVVTVVFADLAASTELAAHLDPERFREVLAAFHGLLTQEITALGGRAEAYIGDAVLGVFGMPIVHADDALRAVRAALRIVDGTSRLGPRLGLSMPMHVRIGINTGSVAIGTASDRNLVIGAEVNVGARRQQAAAPAEILVGETTRELVRGMVAFGPKRMIEAKGFETELPAWPVLHLATAGSRREIPLVDRRRELALLTDTFERMRDRERAHLVTLLGEPGIGKSRVAEEFVGSLPADVRVLAGSSSPFEEEVTFWPLAQMVLREIGEGREAPQERIMERLRESASAWVPAEEVEQASRRLAFALGLGEEGSLENRYHAAEVRSGVLAMLTGLAAEGPVVLVFEDLHDADPLLLDLLEQVIREARRVPLMVLCVARWEFLQERPNWAGGLADAVTLWVEPLAPAHALELAMVAGDLARDDAERVAQHAGGNPFFIVEITGMLRREERDVPPAGAAPSPRLLPATVQAVIAARIDQLSAGARELVRRASVFPRGRFDLDELALLVEPRKELLAEAEDEELLVPDEERPGVWRFGSDLLRDVAYDSLAKRERQRLHLRVANKLSVPETQDRYPRTIAFHLEQAALAALDLNPRERELADRAADALGRAGDLARQRIESRSAADLYQRALALCGPESGWGEREAWFLSMLGEAWYWLGEFDAAEEAFHRALSVAGEESDRVCAHASRFLADIMLTIRGDDVAATELFARATAASRRLGDPYTLARSLLMAGWVPFWRNDLVEAESLFREALDVARSGGRRDAWAESRALVGLANVISPAGDEADALEVGLEGLVVAEEGAQAFTEAVAHETVASSLRRMLRLEEALEHAEAAVGILRELGARWELASALGDRGAIHRLAGRLEDAEGDLREAFVLCRDLKERALVSWTAAELARLLAERGDPSAARSILSDPIARIAEGEPGSATALFTADCVVSLAERDREAAEVAARNSIEAERGLRGVPNALAAQVWWTARLFGEDAAGGTEAVAAARHLLEDHHWAQALAEPDTVADLGVRA